MCRQSSRLLNLTWTCTVCTFINKPAKVSPFNECEMCEHPRVRTNKPVVEVKRLEHDKPKPKSASKPKTPKKARKSPSLQLDAEITSKYSQRLRKRPAKEASMPDSVSSTPILSALLKPTAVPSTSVPSTPELRPTKCIAPKPPSTSQFPVASASPQATLLLAVRSPSPSKSASGSPCSPSSTKTEFVIVTLRPGQIIRLVSDPVKSPGSDKLAGKLEVVDCPNDPPSPVLAIKSLPNCRDKVESPGREHGKEMESVVTSPVKVEPTSKEDLPAQTPVHSTPQPAEVNNVATDDLAVDLQSAATNDDIPSASYPEDQVGRRRVLSSMKSILRRSCSSGNRTLDGSTLSSVNGLSPKKRVKWHPDVRDNEVVDEEPEEPPQKAVKMDIQPIPAFKEKPLTPFKSKSYYEFPRASQTTPYRALHIPPFRGGSRDRQQFRVLSSDGKTPLF